VNLRPSVAPDITLEDARKLPLVVLPHIWHALWRELNKWRQPGGAEWNSRLRVCQTTTSGEYGFTLVTPLTFGLPDESVLPPQVILDATADDEVLRRLLGQSVQVAREDATPPPHMRHYAVRTGIRYGKLSMTSGAGRERAIARGCRGAVPAARARPGWRAPRRRARWAHHTCRVRAAARRSAWHHVQWAARRGLRWAQRTLLGHARLQPPGALRGPAHHRDAGTPPGEDSADRPCALRRRPAATRRDGREGDGDWRYTDPRMQRVADALSQAELTQCAHRNRPLRYDGCTVVTLSAGAVDFLPVTTEISSLPTRLAADGTTHATKRAQQTEERLERAQAELHAQIAVANAYRDARRQMVEQALVVLQRATNGAVLTLLRNLSATTPEAVQVRAAGMILDYAVRAVEISDLAARVDQLT
jgi:hypothetical protein